MSGRIFHRVVSVSEHFKQYFSSITYILQVPGQMDYIHIMNQDVSLFHITMLCKFAPGLEMEEVFLEVLIAIHRSNCKLHKYTTPPQRARKQRCDGESVIVGSGNGLSQLQLQYLSFANFSICIQCMASLLGLRRGLYKGKSLCRNRASFISR